MGTNGGGKTTTIAKLCRYFARQRKSVLLAAGDTFRAAAREQLREWAIKLGGVEMVDFSGAPAAVAYDAAVAGAKRGTDIVLVDTAGRLPSQPNLMAELAKIRRATAKAHSRRTARIIAGFGCLVGAKRAGATGGVF